MPTYDYKCQDCDHLFENFQSISSDRLTDCPKCAKQRSSASFDMAYQALPRIPVTPMIEVRQPKNRSGVDSKAPNRLSAPSNFGDTSASASAVVASCARLGRFRPAP